MLSEEGTLNLKMLSGRVDPNGNIFGNAGDLYTQRTSGGVGKLWQKQVGNLNKTGWVQLTGGGSGVQSVNSGTDITVDNTDPLNPVINFNGTIPDAWVLGGNAGTDPSTNSLGTTDAQPLVIKTNNVERMRVLSTGEVGVSKAPQANIQLSVLNNFEVVNSSTDPVLQAYIDATGGPYFSAGDVGAIANGTQIELIDDDQIIRLDAGVSVIVCESAGSVGIGTSSPAASAKLDVVSTTKGFLPPRMTGAQVEAIGSPANGLMVYATNAGAGAITALGFWGYENGAWVKLSP